MAMQAENRLYTTVVFYRDKVIARLTNRSVKIESFGLGMSDKRYTVLCEKEPLFIPFYAEGALREAILWRCEGFIDPCLDELKLRLDEGYLSPLPERQKAFEPEVESDMNPLYGTW